MIKYSALVTAFIILISISSPAAVYSQSAENADAVISRVWLERAGELLDGDLAGDSINEAAEALKTALEFRTPGRDALYLEARLILEGYGGLSGDSELPPARQAYDLLKHSLEDKTKSPVSDITTFENRAVLWAAQALRLREYRSLLDEYQTWPAGHRENPVLLYAAARASLYLGLDKQAAELALTGETLSHPGINFSELGPAFHSPARPAFRALSVAAGDRQSINTLEAAWRLWGPALEEAIQPWLFSGYIDAETTGRIAEMLSPDILTVLNVLDGTGFGNIPVEYLNNLALIRKVRSINPEMISLENHTGVLVADADYDGYPEEYLRLVNGQPDYRKIDVDQDGRFEWYIAYSESGPWHLQLNDGAVALIYDQDSYPSILSINIREPDSQFALNMHPGAFEWECEGPDGFWSLPLTPDWDENDLWFSTRMVTVRVDNPNEKYSGETRTWLLRGYPLRAEEKRYLTEPPGKMVWQREILYENGVPAAGRRSYRAAQDNPDRRIWELYERFENGEMAGLAWDPDMTGTPLYLRDWALDRYLETQIWDLDADGWIDVRRFAMPGRGTEAAELLITEAQSEDILPWEASNWAPWE